MSAPVIVLKFGGSILTDEESLRVAGHEIYAWRRRGWRVVAVVSALAGRTDALLAACEGDGLGAAAHTTAALLACGERESAALLVHCLDRVGVEASLLDPLAIALRGEGDPLDADPVGFDRSAVRAALDATGCAVVPGFFASAGDGRVVTLGRGGSDLTALVLAQGLGAERCRLVKDVDGLYERDPAIAGLTTPRRFERASHDDVLALDGSIVQHKAVRYAAARDLRFEVGTIDARGPTLVSGAVSRFGVAAPPPRPLRVALLGLGVVGGGVLELLTRLGDRFEVVAASVRDRSRHAELLRAAGLSEVSTDPVQVARSGADVVVEALGGVEPARTAVLEALRSGAHVVTANKALLAAAGPELLAQAARHGRRILTSPSVGGGTPVLEAIARVGVQRLRGVLNGTANYVLERCRHGDRLEAAIDAARAIGLAEADPSRDLDGTDSLDKLKVIALLHDLPVTSMDTSAADVRRVRGAGRLRQVATLDLEGTLRVAVEPVHPDDPLHDLPDAWNAVEIVTAAGETLVVRGKGAGRWPTAESVVADLLALARGDAAEWTASACPVAEVR